MCAISFRWLRRSSLLSPPTLVSRSLFSHPLPPSLLRSFLCCPFCTAVIAPSRYISSKRTRQTAARGKKPAGTPGRDTRKAGWSLRTRRSLEVSAESADQTTDRERSTTMVGTFTCCTLAVFIARANSKLGRAEMSCGTYPTRQKVADCILFLARDPCTKKMRPLDPGI